ncbi:MAG TPA: RNA polymerase sigma factor [Gemmatimonadota bacterium]|nr:RNA polymerase sigma factor [Gemmatimonadota bacterium]
MNQGEPFAEAFRIVFGAEFHSLFRYLDRLTGDSAAASDFAQEAFVRLYERGAMPDDTRAWLATVANNLMRDEYRKSTRRRDILGAHPNLVPYAEPESDAEEAAVRRDRRERVRRALNGLPLRSRQALLLRTEGYSYREIAAALDCRVSGIGKLIVRATRQFRTAYEAGDAFD